MHDDLTVAEYYRAPRCDDCTDADDGGLRVAADDGLARQRPSLTPWVKTGARRPCSWSMTAGSTIGTAELAGGNAASTVMTVVPRHRPRAGPPMHRVDLLGHGRACRFDHDQGEVPAGLRAAKQLASKLQERAAECGPFSFGALVNFCQF